MDFYGTMEQRALLMMVSETLVIPDSHKELFWDYGNNPLYVRLHMEFLGMLIAALKLGKHKVSEDFLNRCATADGWGHTQKTVFADMARMNGVWKNE